MGVPQPHDKLVKALLEQPEAAAALLRERLPKEIASRLGPELPQRVDGTFVDAALRESQTDRLFRVRLKTGEQAFIYCLIEHKCEPDCWVWLQLLRYQTRIYARFRNELGEAQNARLPMVFCLVLYHGAPAWTGPCRFTDRMAVDEPLRPYVLDFPFAVFDVGLHRDEDLSRHPPLRAGLKALKYSYRFPKADTIEVLVTLFQDLPSDRPELFQAVLCYILVRYSHVRKHDVMKALARVGQEEQMVSKALQEILAEERANAEARARAAKAEGRAEGKAEGRAEGTAQAKASTLLRQLERRFGPIPQAALTRLSGASVQELDVWLDRVLDATSLDEVLGSLH